METTHTFAGFEFPKTVVLPPRKPLAARLVEFKKRSPKSTGPYYTMGAIRKRGDDSTSFYLDSDFMPGLRWEWADDVAASIKHRGWLCDEFQGDTIRGLVMTLPAGRGFLAGWSMGDSMASAVGFTIYDDKLSAALAADGWAESVAESEREYRENEETDAD